MKNFAALVALFGATVLSSAALAGPVTFQDGTVTVTYHDSVTNNADTKPFTITLPGSDTVTYTGTPDPAFPEFGSNRGNSGATFDVQDLADGGSFDLKVFTQNNGSQEHTDGGDTDLALGFTTSQPLHYNLLIDPLLTSSTQFRAKFSDIDESLQTDALGTVTGSLAPEGTPISKTFEGTLPAGSYDISLFVQGLNGREDTGGGQGALTLTLSAEENPPPPVGIPLPPAVWSGMITLAGAGGLGALAPVLRRRRA